MGIDGVANFIHRAVTDSQRGFSSGQNALYADVDWNDWGAVSTGGDSGANETLGSVVIDGPQRFTAPQGSPLAGMQVTIDSTTSGNSTVTLQRPGGPSFELTCAPNGVITGARSGGTSTAYQCEVHHCQNFLIPSELFGSQFGMSLPPGSRLSVNPETHLITITTPSMGCNNDPGAEQVQTFNPATGAANMRGQSNYQNVETQGDFTYGVNSAGNRVILRMHHTNLHNGQPETWTNIRRDSNGQPIGITIGNGDATLNNQLLRWSTTPALIIDTDSQGHLTSNYPGNAIPTSVAGTRFGAYSLTNTTRLSDQPNGDITFTTDLGNGTQDVLVLHQNRPPSRRIEDIPPPAPPVPPPLRIAHQYGDGAAGIGVALTNPPSSNSSSITNPNQFTLRYGGAEFQFTASENSGTPPRWNVSQVRPGANPNASAELFSRLGARRNSDGQITGNFEFGSGQMAFESSSSSGVRNVFRSDGTRITSDHVANTETTISPDGQTSIRYWDTNGWRQGRQVEFPDPHTGRMVTMISFDNPHGGQPTGMFIDRSTNTRTIIYGQHLAPNTSPSWYNTRAEYDAVETQRRHPGAFLYRGQNCPTARPNVRPSTPTARPVGRPNTPTARPIGRPSTPTPEPAELEWI